MPSPSGGPIVDKKGQPPGDRRRVSEPERVALRQEVDLQHSGRKGAPKDDALDVTLRPNAEGPSPLCKNCRRLPEPMLFAFLRGLEVVDLAIPTRFCSDCLLVVKTANAGEAALDDSKIEAVDLWERIFRLAHGRPHAVEKAKAHVSQIEAQTLGLEALALWFGNNHVDVHAKRGAKTHVVPKELRGKIVEHDGAYADFLRFMCEVNRVWIRLDQCFSQGLVEREAPSRVPKPKVLLAFRIAREMDARVDGGDGCLHQLVEFGGFAACLVCGKRRRGIVGLASLRTSKCLGPLGCTVSVAVCSRVRASTSVEERRLLLTSRSHTLRTTGPDQ